jgi:hypothetical protein
VAIGTGRSIFWGYITYYTLLKGTKMNKKQKLLTVLMAMGLAIMFGCSAIQDIITPTYVSPDAATWADTTPKLFMPYTTLFDAKRVGMAIDYKIIVEKFKGGYYKGMTNLSILAGEEIKATVFSPDGPIGLLLPTLFGGTLGAMLISKPDDKKKIRELEVKNGS